MTNFVDGWVSTVTSSQTKMENKKFKNKKLPTLTDIAPLTAEQSPRKKIENFFTKFHKNSQKFLHSAHDSLLSFIPNKVQSNLRIALNFKAKNGYLTGVVNNKNIYHW